MAGAVIFGALSFGALISGDLALITGAVIFGFLCLTTGAGLGFGISTIAGAVLCSFKFFCFGKSGLGVLIIALS